MFTVLSLFDACVLRTSRYASRSDVQRRPIIVCHEFFWAEVYRMRISPERTDRHDERATLADTLLAGVHLFHEVSADRRTRSQESLLWQQA